MTRVLIVDDYEDWRRTVRKLIQALTELQVVCEVSDGVEAVQKAAELKPDLILLDIGLPKLNGIETARRIRQISPSSKIIFLSQDNSVEVVEAALSTGAEAYVCKTDAGSDLLCAIEAVLWGKQFASGSLKGRELVVTCYSGEASFVDDFVRFIESALRDEKVVVALVSELHWRKLFERLQEHDWDLPAVIRQGRLRFVDVNNAFSMFMVNDWPDPVRLLKAIDDLVLEAAKAEPGKRPRVAACGECAPTLWEQGKLEAAIQLEHLWDQIARSHSMDTLCGYPLSARLSDEGIHAWQRICAEHSDIHVY